MGVDFSNESLVTAVMEQGGTGSLAASAVGFNYRRKHILDAHDTEERIKRYYAANQARIAEEIRAVREKMPQGILAANLMAAMSDFTAMVDAIGSSGQVDLLLVGAGLPRELPKQMEKYPHMRYAPIVSSDRAASIMLRSAKGTSRPPDAFYVELPQYAGGHLGAKDVEDALDTEKFDPKKLHDEIRNVIPETTPLILAGGIAYGPDITHAYEMGYDGISMGTRLLITQESGLPKNLMEKYYLDSRYGVVTTMHSPAGLPSRHIDGPTDPADWAAEVHRQCVNCIGASRCGFNKPGGHENSYCIARRLPKTRRGEENGVLFTGSRLVEIRHDPLYRNGNGDKVIPTVNQAVEFVFAGGDGKGSVG